jgi:hypothetical protein
VKNHEPSPIFVLCFNTFKEVFSVKAYVDNVVNIHKNPSHNAQDKNCNRATKNLNYKKGSILTEKQRNNGNGKTSNKMPLNVHYSSLSNLMQSFLIGITGAFVKSAIGAEQIIRNKRTHARRYALGVFSKRGKLKELLRLTLCSGYCYVEAKVGYSGCT